MAVAVGFELALPGGWKLPPGPETTARALKCAIGWTDDRRSEPGLSGSFVTTSVTTGRSLRR